LVQFNNFGIKKPLIIPVNKRFFGAKSWCNSWCNFYKKWVFFINFKCIFCYFLGLGKCRQTA